MLTDTQELTPKQRSVIHKLVDKSEQSFEECAEQYLAGFLFCSKHRKWEPREWFVEHGSGRIVSTCLMYNQGVKSSNFTIEQYNQLMEIRRFASALVDAVAVKEKDGVKRNLTALRVALLRFDG